MGIVNRLADVIAFILCFGKEKNYRLFLEALWERYPVSGAASPKLEISVYLPERASPDPADRPMVERIFAAYENAKRAQHQADGRFQPSSMWNNILRTAYADLTESLPNSDLGRFHDFVANFGASDVATGIEESRLIRTCVTDGRKRRHLERRVAAPLIQRWLRFESNGRDLSALVLPSHGNLGGFLVNGELISLESVCSEVHARLVAGFLRTERPVISELGGGFGRLFYFLSRHLERFCYVGIDLPEVLCCASYYLMKTFPEKRFLLYGEQQWNGESLQDYDFLLLPSFEIPKLPDNSIDLFINENSLGEVEASACRNYVHEICRCARAFWHRNHEVRRLQFEGNTASLLNREYPIAADKFIEVVRYCDLGSLIRADRLNRWSDMYWYYYQSRFSHLESPSPHDDDG